MKKAFPICFLLFLLAATASAQRNLGSVRLRADITRLQRTQLQRDLIRFRIVQRNVERDGIITSLEEKRLTRMKRKHRREALRVRHNHRKRPL